MRKIICLFSVVILCVALVCPAFAAEGIFVPSITYKDGPKVGGASFGGDSQQSLDPQPTHPVTGDTVPDYSHEDVDGCLVITSIIQAQEKTTDIYEEDRQLLLEVYEMLGEGIMEFAEDVTDQDGESQEQEPSKEEKGLRKALKQLEKLLKWEEHREDDKKPKKDGIEKEKDGSLRLIFDNNKYVIKELVDVSFQKSDCVEVDHLHKETLDHEDIHIDVEFDLGVAADELVIVLHYHEGKWEPIKKVVNNGDGTLTCTFDHFCPVAFCTEAEASTTADTDHPGNIWLWVIVMLAALSLLVVLVIRRKKAEEKEPADRKV